MRSAFSAKPSNSFTFFSLGNCDRRKDNVRKAESAILFFDGAFERRATERGIQRSTHQQPLATSPPSRFRSTAGRRCSGAYRSGSPPNPGGEAKLIVRGTGSA